MIAVLPLDFPCRRCAQRPGEPCLWLGERWHCHKERLADARNAERMIDSEFERLRSGDGAVAQLEEGASDGTKYVAFAMGQPLGFPR